MPQQARLGEVTLPPIGVGTWAWGDRRVWGYDRDYGRSEVEGAFWSSLKAGLTFFDTAEVYGFGTSERILGDLVSQSPQPVQIATKYAPFRPTGKALIGALDRSLQRLGVPHVDLYQVHFPPFFVRIESLMASLAEVVHRGKARAVGVSNFNAALMRRAHDALALHGVTLASNQVEYSLLDRTPESDGVLRACRELGVTLIAYSPLAMGWLGGRYDPSQPKLPGRLSRYLRAHGPDGLRRTLGLVREIGEAHGKTPSQVALNWLLSQPGVMIIPGAKTAPQAAENAGSLGWELTPEDLQALDQVTRATPK
jgi:aryl-alcohol dehydrogenase-like predicted oxidoreductase